MVKDIRVLRRNQQVVPWRREKIEIALRKAFIDENAEPEKAVTIAEAVEQKIFSRGLPLVDIETIQDVVEQELQLAGFSEIAQSYRAYRLHRQELRESANHHSDISHDEYCVRFENGEEELWTLEKWECLLKTALQDLSVPLSVEELVAHIRKVLVPEMPYDNFKREVLSQVLRLAEQDPGYSRLAARLRLIFLYREVLGHDLAFSDFESLSQAVKSYFQDYITRGIQEKWLDARLGEFDLDILSDALNLRLDFECDWEDLSLLVQEYLFRDEDGIQELPQIFWMRVAMGVFIEDAGRTESNVIELYFALSHHLLMLSTPTLLYAGTCHPQLLPSYVYTLRDSMKDIMSRGIAENAYASKWGAGLGGCWTAIRAKGSFIEGTQGTTEGVRPFLELHAKQLAIANQGPNRRSGAGCAYLDIWHRDAEDFVELRKQLQAQLPPRKEPELQTSLLIPDLFMKRLEESDAVWTFFDPCDVPDLESLVGTEFESRYLHYEQLVKEGKLPGKSIPIIPFWQKILAFIFETGFPRVAFKDLLNRSNMGSPHGMIPCSSLFGESAMNVSDQETAGSAFGSISLTGHLKSDGGFDFEQFKETIHLAVKALDAVLDATDFISENVQRHCEHYRGISLGLMGLHQFLRVQGVAMDSDSAREWISQISEFLAYHTLLASTELAVSKGVAPAFEGSLWSEGKFFFDETPRVSLLQLPWDELRNIIRERGLRNIYLLSHAPTSRTSTLCRTSAGLLPIRSNATLLRLPNGEMIVRLLPQLVDALKEKEIWTPTFGNQLGYLDGDLSAMQGLPEELCRVYATASQLEMEPILALFGLVQSWIDQAQSLPLFFHHPTFSQLSGALKTAWRSGIKTLGRVYTERLIMQEKSRIKFAE